MKTHVFLHCNVFALFRSGMFVRPLWVPRDPSGALRAPPGNHDCWGVLIHGCQGTLPVSPETGNPLGSLWEYGHEWPEQAMWLLLKVFVLQKSAPQQLLFSPETNAAETKRCNAKFVFLHRKLLFLHCNLLPNSAFYEVKCNFGGSYFLHCNVFLLHCKVFGV